MIFKSQTYFTMASGRDTSGLVRSHSSHLIKALRILRERLLVGDKEAVISEQSVMVVLTLAIHAYMTGDHQSASSHLNGLSRIVELRGGIASFRNNAKLLVQIIR
jgi:hypothetical protein